MNDLDIDLDRNTPWVDMSACVKFGLDRPSRLAGHTEHRYRQTNRHNAFYYIDKSTHDNAYTVIVKRISGAVLAVLTILALVIRFSVEKFAIQKRPWRMTYIQHYINAITIGVTVLVVAIPEGLPLAVTLALAYSVRVSRSFPWYLLSGCSHLARGR